VLRLSIDSKATVVIGPFSRRGRSRVPVQAADHDFTPTATLVPFGIFLPDYGETYLYFVSSRVTSDCIVDCLLLFWMTVRRRFPRVKTLLINQDNGPENHTRRTQFMQRLVEFVDTFGLTVRVACYPPYHSKYNPIERVWGGLEQHWNGSLLDTVQTVLNFARSLRWRGRHWASWAACCRTEPAPCAGVGATVSPAGNNAEAARSLRWRGRHPLIHLLTKTYRAGAPLSSRHDPTRTASGALTCFAQVVCSYRTLVALGGLFPCNGLTHLAHCPDGGRSSHGDDWAGC
jgi:hypothetical protein